MTKLTSLGAIALFSLSLPLVAFAANKPMQPPMPQTSAVQHKAMMVRHQATAARKEAATARAHAMMATNANSLKTTHMHLHHVVNCLAGPNGKGFDSSFEDPCKGMGHGALNDAAGNDTLTGVLKKAMSEAQAGLKSNDEATARMAAKKVAALLGKAARH